MDKRLEVTATDFDMSFWRKAGCTIKREVAAIPAGLILIIAAFLLMGILGRMLLCL